MKRDIDFIATKIAELITQSSPEELDKIRLFKNRADKLSCNSIIQQGYAPIYDLEINNEGVLDCFQMPSEEALHSLLILFRHFWLQDEPCYFFKILKIIDRYVPEARSQTKLLKEFWKQGLFHSAHIIIDGVELTSEKLIDLWLIAEFFHNDYAKRIDLDILIGRADIVSPGFVKFLLIGSICECCRVIFEVNKLLGKINFEG
jgi:hypothetical protein